MFVLVRRLSLASFVSLFTFTASSQIDLSAFVSLLFFLLLQVFFRPYASNLENALESLSLFTVLVSFLTRTLMPTTNILVFLILDSSVFLFMAVFLVRIYFRRLRVLVGKLKEYTPLLASKFSSSPSSVNTETPSGNNTIENPDIFPIE